MLNGIVQPVNDDANEVSRQTLQPYQSLWLAHWKRTGSDAGGDNVSPSASRSEEPDCIARRDGVPKGVVASSRSADGFGSIKKRALVSGYNFTKIGRKSAGSDRMISSLDGQDADALLRLNSPNGGFVEPPSHVSPDEFDIEGGKFDKGKEAAVSDGMRILEQEQCCGTDLLCERKFRLSSQSDNSPDEWLRESRSSDYSLSMVNKAWSSKMQRRSDSSEENGSIKSHIDFYCKPKLQKCDHGLGTRGMWSSVDVPGRASAEFPRFSRSNTNLLITKRASVDAFNENETFRSKRVISNIDGNLSSDVHSKLPFFGQSKHKVQIQFLSSSDDSRVKVYKKDSNASKFTIRNELSAETDTLEKQYEKNLCSASNSTTSTKALNMDSNEVAFPRKVRISSTKSFTMETEKLLKHVTHNPKAKSDSRVDELQNGNRWVKRLKLSSSNYSIQGETAPNHALITPRERTRKLFNGIPRSNTTKSRPNPSDERSVAEEDQFSKNSNDKAKALLLSHAWVQRWLHGGGRETKRENPKVGVEKEHFPSIAAMALMAKVLTCFQECELQKRGSYTVWNTKTV